MRHELAVAFRAVALDRLPTVLAHGVDVAPTDDPLYVDDFEKAWEYSGLPKVVMAFVWEGLERTFRTLPADASEAEQAALRETYPHAYPHGDRLWLSRIDDPNPARRGYELAHARWIPNNPFDSLKAVFVCGAEQDLVWAESQTIRDGATAG